MQPFWIIVGRLSEQKDKGCIRSHPGLGENYGETV